jgi:uncharacterized membrane protein
MITNIFKKRAQNVFVAMLQYLNVKHTTQSSNKFYNEHPHKYNLYGISKMLSDYGVKNVGYKIEDKESNIFNLPTPFVAFFGGSFIPVIKISSNNVHYNWNGKGVSITHEKFLQGWQDIALFAESDNNSIEPNYRENKRKEIFATTGKWLLFMLVVGVVIFQYTSKQLFENLGVSVLLVFNFIGVMLGCLLVLKQMRFNSSYSDKICSLFKIGDCNNVLETDAAKIFNLISWSEIGLGYFISNVILLLYTPELISFFVIINICALPYTLWSIWYQKFKAKQWCSLCLGVQGLLWILFFTNILFGLIQLPDFNLANILKICLCYLIPPLTINILASRLSEGNKTETITQELNSIKSNEDVFIALLKEQPRYEVNHKASRILWGNPDSDILVTIITNPHCEPCSKLHARIEKLLESSGNNLCIQYIFSYFEKYKELVSSNLFMIGAYMNNELPKTKKIYNDWFGNGKYSRDEFFETHKVLIDSYGVKEEFHKHEDWVKMNSIRATPTILVNGYKLPDNYTIEDLEYFKELEL